MGALVVYESMFGNTRAVAEAVAAGIATALPVTAVQVGAAPALAEVEADLLVVGAPTHAFGLSRESTRRDAAQRTTAGLVSPGAGLREWLAGGGAAPRPPVAAFDTHTWRPRLPGRAGTAAERRLHRLGCEVVAPAESFAVTGYSGPLRPGELDRALAWGARLGRLAVAGAPAR